MIKFWIAAFAICGATAAQADCMVSNKRSWEGLTIEANSSGPKCGSAVATLTLRRSSGAVAWTHAYDTTQLLNFSQTPHDDTKAMTKLLGEWISGEGFMKSADRLAVDGEFPFSLAQDVEAKAFATYRKEKLAVFCFIQGMESGTCLMRGRDGGLTELGVQNFPG